MNYSIEKERLLELLQFEAMVRYLVANDYSGVIRDKLENKNNIAFWARNTMNVDTLKEAAKVRLHTEFNGKKLHI